MKSCNLNTARILMCRFWIMCFCLAVAACRPPLSGVLESDTSGESANSTSTDDVDTLTISLFTPVLDDQGGTQTDAVSLKISGAVTDINTGDEIADADIFIRVEDDVRATAKTNESGRFCVAVALDPLRKVNVVVKASKSETDQFGQITFPVFQDAQNLANIRSNTDPTPEVSSSTIHRTCPDNISCTQNAVDGVEQTSYKGANVVNNAISGCPPPPSGERWFRINFGRLVELQTVIVRWGEPCYGSNFSLMVSSEEAPECPSFESLSWQVLKRIPQDDIPDTGNGGTDLITLANEGQGVQATWFSLIFSSAGGDCSETGPQFVINELEVYGRKDLTTDSCL